MINFAANSGCHMAKCHSPTAITGRVGLHFIQNAPSYVEIYVTIKH